MKKRHRIPPSYRIPPNTYYVGETQMTEEERITRAYWHQAATERAKDIVPGFDPKKHRVMFSFGWPKEVRIFDKTSRVIARFPLSDCL